MGSPSGGGGVAALVVGGETLIRHRRGGQSGGVHPATGAGCLLRQQGWHRAEVNRKDDDLRTEVTAALLTAADPAVLALETMVDFYSAKEGRCRSGCYRRGRISGWHWRRKESTRLRPEPWPEREGKRFTAVLEAAAVALGDFRWSQ